MNSWRRVRIGSLITPRNDRWRLGDARVPYIGLEHIGEGTLSLHGVGSTDDVAGDQRSFRGGDILFGRLRPYFRKVVRPDFDGACSPEIWVLRSESSDLDQSYLRWLVSSHAFVDWANSGTSGTRMPRATWEHSGNFEFDLPSIAEQRAIASVLDAIDDKLCSNPLTSDSIVDLLVAGYREIATHRKPLSSLFSLQRGVSYSGAMLASDGVPMLNLANFGTDGRLRADGFKYLNETPPANRQAVPGDLLIANTDLTQERKIVGRALLVPKLARASVMCFSHHVYKAMPSPEAPQGAALLGFLALHQPRYIDRMRACATGTTVAAVSSRDILSFELDWPSDESLLAIVARARVSFEFIWSLARESRTLQELREALLPDIISGRREVEPAA